MTTTAIATPPARENELLASDPGKALSAERRLAAPLISRLDDVLPPSLRGSRLSVREYISTWRSLKEVVLDAIYQLHPDRVTLVGSHAVLCDAAGAPSTLADEALDLAALRAPLSAWVAAYGLGTGTALALLAEIRAYVPGVPALNPPATAAFPTMDVSRALVGRFARLMVEELRENKTPLERVMEILDLNLTEVGALFGVSRQAALQWLDEGVPAARQGKLGTVLAIAELLERKLRAGRVSLVARRPADAYGGRTMLAMIEADQHEELHRSVRDSFDWSGTA